MYFLKNWLFLSKKKCVVGLKSVFFSSLKINYENLGNARNAQDCLRTDKKCDFKINNAYLACRGVRTCSKITAENQLEAEKVGCDANP